MDLQYTKMHNLLKTKKAAFLYLRLSCWCTYYSVHLGFYPLYDVTDWPLGVQVENCYLILLQLMTNSLTIHEFFSVLYFIYSA